MLALESMRVKAEGMLKSHLFAETAALLKLHADTDEADYGALSLYAQALAGLGRDAEALEMFEQATRSDPVAGRGEYNCALFLERLARYDSAVVRARQAIRAGYNTEDSQALLARSSQGAGQFDVAEAAYRASLALNPLRGDVHRDLAQLVWMRTADVVVATSALRAALEDHPNHADLVTQLAKALDHGGEPDAAYYLLATALAADPDMPTQLDIAAFTIARDQGLKDKALHHALRAAKASPGNPAALLAVCDAKMALGEVDEILGILEKLHAQLPFAQQITARLATALRLTGQPSYRDMLNYDAFVKTFDVKTINGWNKPEDFLTDLAAALRENHKLETHPFDQSIRKGTQTLSNIYLSNNRAIRGFFDFAERQMEQYMEALPHSSNSFTVRNTGRVKIIDAWSVKQLKGGSHQNHVHQNGWLSTVFYADLPSDIDSGERAGWLKFGEPGIETAPTLPPDQYIRPKLGRLVIFPSYAWHGTLPFEGTGERLTIAFDAVPVG